jgi:hypothetical protein
MKEFGGRSEQYIGNNILIFLRVEDLFNK